MLEFALPDVGEGVAEGEVLEWHVAVGDRVTEDDLLAEVETDKAAVDVPSPTDGVVRERHAEVGDIVATGEVLVAIEERADAAEPASEERPSAETTANATPTGGGRVFAPPSVRRLGRERGVDLTAIEGSGPGGRLTEADVEAAASGSDTDGPKPAISSVDDDGPTSVVSAVDDSGPTSVVSSVRGDGDRREPYRGVRRTVGERMARSRREVPHATHHDNVAVPGLVEARERLQPLAEARGVRLTYTPFLLKCVAAALDEHPVLATQLDTEAEEIIYRGGRDIGVATATDHGLVVPVVEDVDEKGLLELAADLSDRVERARSRDLDREELRGGVFSVTDVGAIGGEYADPIINVPETAILSVGALKERPIAADGAVVARPTLTLSLAVDRRVIDGADAARFLETLRSSLADPTRLLLD